MSGQEPAPPPAYTQLDSGGPAEAARSQPTDNIDITAAFEHLRIDEEASKEGLRQENCIAHLKLLHAIHELKEDVGYTDGLFGLYDSQAVEDANCLDLDTIHIGKGVKIEELDKIKVALSKIREKRWALFVARAVDRYEVWWKSMHGTNYLNEDAMEKRASEEYSHFPTQSVYVRKWKEDELPPLDVLMVFHSHMLNPRAFLEDAIRTAMRDLWHGGMPWHLINAAIGTNFSYSVSKSCQEKWTQATARSWGNTDDPEVKIIDCPYCRVPNHLPWTTCAGGDHGDNANLSSRLVGSGYGDGNLSHKCVACEQSICKEALSVRKFIQDTALLLTHSVPMPGTVLDPQSGEPVAILSRSLANVYPRTFPNRMLKLDLRIEVQEIFNAHKNPTMETVKELIEKVLTDPKRLCHINSMSHRYGSRYRICPKSKNCVRKMMSRYWENFSPFALDLCGAVMRQGVFIDKMVKLDWLHSPSANETMNRLLKKYVNFLSLMNRHPRQVCVPTLDVDLAWHTHQLSPPAYYSYTVRKTTKFIDHDDKIEETLLNDAFEWTSKTYQEEFHELYSECTCWYCESIRASHTSSVASFFGSSKGHKYLEKFHQSGQAKLCPPDNSAHISAHNAVRPIGSRDMAINFRRSRQEAKLEENYQKARKRAEKKGRTLPPRDEYYNHWGYSYYSE
ncbi:hypothetical protein QQS21_004665 [Conoideocrella luteorostrata]|uniref:Alpha-ketoglutarate-dependent sulfonate dioxygenase n=1 Tax=Conoideocrella luteorostrata TaxID=1105319 RepID=A0AAJ0CR23_9HYPO|nr:hypothetical protein QQS21_004665 [Conoideocrella luteorostrata]